ncbi:LysR family transcriptional regulator [Paractinoplanes rhizophilus]|uniref:LysR family transcriptional regulator n=1 Tax=Paractinoplanes rhizophilus TaxID=1416877 RepID=A0ABW2I5Q6_9ACTN
MLDIWTLRVLVEVADQGSFSGAASKLSMTQPAVSRQIAGMERRVGVSLFRRVPRGVHLTTAGEVAVGQAREILARMQALEARLGSFTDLETGHLRLSAFPSANTSFMPDAIRRMNEAYPGVTQSLVRIEPGEALSAIRDGTVDLGLVTAWELHPNLVAAKYSPPAWTIRSRPSKAWSSFRCWTKNCWSVCRPGIDSRISPGSDCAS